MSLCQYVIKAKELSFSLRKTCSYHRWSEKLSIVSLLQRHLCIWSTHSWLEQRGRTVSYLSKSEIWRRTSESHSLLVDLSIDMSLLRSVRGKAWRSDQQPSDSSCFRRRHSSSLVTMLSDWEKKMAAENFCDWRITNWVMADWLCSPS